MDHPRKNRTSFVSFNMPLGKCGAVNIQNACIDGAYTAYTLNGLV